MPRVFDFCAAYLRIFVQYGSVIKLIGAVELRNMPELDQIDTKILRQLQVSGFSDVENTTN
ncbi:hypothetical protein [Thalassospira profundimaris]|uniref:hypothetical protein n=1 Tax=Thalassospira profundimaris TaxID=502049 RepID=UPI000287291E|nr:hypothetical protein [Thalassospira profundimaris]EKF09320.1 hypothetical protein TH2_05498 [Thalassospira profundimaris WP0211]